MFVLKKGLLVLKGHFPALRFGPSFSSPAFYSLCYFQVLQIQRPTRHTPANIVGQQGWMPDKLALLVARWTLSE